MSNDFVTRAAAAGIELPDPTGAPDGQVVTTASGAYVLAAPAGGGPTLTVDTLDSATGWTLVDATPSGDGEASITGGVGRLEAAVSAWLHWKGSHGFNGPSLRRAIPHVDPSHYAVSVRLAAMTAASVAYAHLSINAGTTPRLAAWIRGNGEVRGTIAETGTDLGSALAAGTALLDGRDWLRIVVRGRSVDMLFGRSASTSTRPTTWTHLWSRVEPDGVACSTVSLGLATYAHGAPVTVDFDDLTFEAMS